MLGWVARYRQTAGLMSESVDRNRQVVRQMPGLPGRIRLSAGLAITLGWIVTAHSTPNILLLIGDDMGVETVASYGVGENPPMTAHIDDLAGKGVRFTRFWAQPVCSPTRATIMTGRYGFRTGIGRPVTNRGPLPEPPRIPDWALPYVNTETGGGMGMGADGLQSLPRHGLGVDEYTLTHAFDANGHLGYSTAAIGKWHLADADNGWQDHATRIGFDYFNGGLTGGPESYFAWTEVVDGEVTGATGYAPTDKVDDAIAWIGARGDRPWFMWMGFNLPHTPLHTPPEDARDGNSNSQYGAMIEAMDTHIGRLLAAISPDVLENTYVLFLGDNGTQSGNVTAPFQNGRAKGTVYQGGVNVPFIVTGPGVERGAVSDALVNSTDLFVTIMEMAGIDPAETIPADVTHDSVSFLDTLSDPAASPREWIYADEFFGGFEGVETADYAMRDERYKLMRFDGVEEFYDLQADPYEHENLLAGALSAEERAAYGKLLAEIEKLRSSE
ncbi:MAG: sulfatase-like hydrolase/transferase [Proteobacteria bacterium]|nr:sulfatase-like hydrolase/transferase [Pseudomonadota bacterium]